MVVFTKVDEVKSFVKHCKKEGKTIGFVPTMGALHEGHMDLVKKSKRDNDITICSIFVNPTQFNDQSDLNKYPRTLEQDIILLSAQKIDVVFTPSAEEIYPAGQEIKVPDLGGLDTVMEGVFRPGHFQGVAQVVKRLLDITTPNRLYMGQKDFQQFTIIQYMLNTLQMPVELVVCKTKREKNGLAMSSRNQRLSLEMKEKAGLIFRTLTAIKRQVNKKSPSELIKYAKKRLSTSFFEVEYISIVDGFTLQPVETIKKNSYAVVCIALWSEGVRLIDNMILVPPKP